MKINFIFPSIVVVLFGILFPLRVNQADFWTMDGRYGFGDSKNTAAKLFRVKDTSMVYVATRNEDGMQLYSRYRNSLDWNKESVDDWGMLLDMNNTKVTAVAHKGKKTFVATKNKVTGAEVWAISGSFMQTQSEQMNQDGFGNEDLGRVLHLITFDYKVFAFVQNTANQTVHVLRYAGAGTNWKEVTILDSSFSNLDSVAVFDDAIFLANGDNAKIFRSLDGHSFTQVATVKGAISQLKVGPAGKQLFALGTSDHRCYEKRPHLYSSTDGLTWSPIVDRPVEHFCYTELVAKPFSSELWFLGFDAQDAVIYKRTDGKWKTVTSSGFDNSKNRKFSDGIRFGGTITTATQNQGGLEVWWTLNNLLFE